MTLESSVLVTGLYQLPMLQAYLNEGLEEPAVFEFFARTLPPCRGFLMAAGLEQALAYLEQLRFTPQELDWLARSGRFSQDFVDYLECLRFTGDVHAMAEGTIFFPPEPILCALATPGPRVRPAAGLWDARRPWDGMAVHVTTCPTTAPAIDARTVALPHGS